MKDDEEVHLSREDLRDIAPDEKSQCICKHPKHGRCRRKRFHAGPHIGTST